MIAHSSRAHMRLAASAAPRWMKCPASVARSESLPEPPSSSAADWGTLAHEWLEWALESGKESVKHWIGQPLGYGGAESTKLSADMADSVDDVLRYVWGRVDAPGHIEMLSERKYSVSFNRDVGGTCDVTLLFCTPNGNFIEIVDAKFGFGIVEPDSWQLKCYAIGAAEYYAAQGIAVAGIRTTIAQPRAPHPSGAVRSHDFDALDVGEFTAEIALGALATEDADAQVCAGEHCKFCPVAYYQKCPEFDAQAHAAATDAYGQTINPTTLTPAQLGQRVRQAVVLQVWLDNLNSYVDTEARAGRMPTGLKWVAGRGSREWRKSEAETLAALQRTGNGVDFAPRELLSVAQAEKAIGKAKFAELAKSSDLVENKPGKPTLAFAEDKRPEVQPGRADAFDAVAV